jgi:8-amino-7-oxononanoate synthase
VLESTGSDLCERIARELDDLRDGLQFRTLETPDGINLSSNDYLGLATDPRLKDAVAEAVGRASVIGSTGSRLLSGNAPEWEQVELEFARFAGTEAALYFGSGYAANVGLLSAILKPGDLVFSDALNHASLIDGMRLSGAKKIVYPHCDLPRLEAALKEQRGRPGVKLIVTESIFSMEGDVAPLTDLLRLAEKYGGHLIVDEAHATGVCGPEGRGIAAEMGIESAILAVVHPCGKAFASAGAFVCCQNRVRDYLINRARTFIFSTAMPPYLAGQIQGALALVRRADEQREHLRRISEALRHALAGAGIPSGASTTHIVPVYLGSNEAALGVAAQLHREGFSARAIRPPTVPPGTARIRLSLTAAIPLGEVRRLARTIEAAFKACPSRSPNAALHA